jgi:hypothetical protein
VQVNVLTAARANIIGDLNLWTCAQLLRRTGSPENLRIVLHPRMVHGKAIVGDGEWVDIGSTNFTSPSHGGYEEVDLFCRDADFARKSSTPSSTTCATASGRSCRSVTAEPSWRSSACSRRSRPQEEVEGPRAKVANVAGRGGAAMHRVALFVAAGALLPSSMASAWEVKDPFTGTATSASAPRRCRVSATFRRRPR